MDKNKIFLGFIVAGLGLFLLTSPEVFDAVIRFFVVILGIVAVVDGVFILAATRNLIVDPQYNLIVTVRGIMSVIVGLTSVLLPLLVANAIWTAMAYTLAVYLLISAGMQLYTAVKLHRNGIMIRKSLIEIITSFVLAAVLFVIPLKSIGKFIVGICGATLLISGLGMVFMEWKNRPISITPDSVETVKEEKSESDSENQEN